MTNDEYDKIFEEYWDNSTWWVRWTVNKINAKLWFLEGMLVGCKYTQGQLRKHITKKDSRSDE